MKKTGGPAVVVAALLLVLAVWLIVRGPSGKPSSPLDAPSSTDAPRVSDPTARGGIDIEAAANLLVTVQTAGLRRVVTTDARGRASLRDLPAGRYKVAGVAVDVRANEVALVKLPVAEAPAGAWTLRGTVHDLTGGDVPGAEVWIDANVVRTDEAGAFVAKLNAGSYALRLRAPGYAEATETIEIAGDLTIDLVLHPASSIHGTVVHADGAPAAGARVSVGRRRAEPSTLFTGDDGSFSVEGLPAGEFDVRAATATEAGGVEEVRLPPASARTVRIVLAPAATLSGTVRGPDNAPVAGAKVTLLRGDVTAGDPETTTARDGTYRFLALRPGILGVEGCAPGFGCTESAKFFVGNEALTVDVKLEPEATLRLHVVDREGHPVAGAEAKDFEDDVTCTSDATGDCVLRGFRPRSISLEVTHPTAGFEHVEVVLGRGVTKREVKLRAAVTLRGVVRWDDGSAAAGVHVTASDRVARTGPDGRWELANVPSFGSILVRAARALVLSGRSIDEMVNSFDTPRQRRVKTKAGETVENIELVLQHDDRAIRGTVVGPDGAPAAYAAVGVIRQSGMTELITDHVSLESTPRTYAGADGAFTVDGLDAGKYIVWAHDEDNARGSVKDVATGKSDVAIKLGVPAGIAGTVTDPSGKPVPLFVVELDVTAGLRDEGRARRFTDGRFTWKGVPPGHHDIKVAAGAATAQQTFEVRDGETTPLALIVKPGVTVTGRVVVWPEMTPIEGLVLTVSDPLRHRSEPTGADGRFRIPDVLPDLVDLVADGLFGAGLGDVWPRDLRSKPGPFDVGDLALVPATEEDGGPEPGASIEDMTAQMGRPAAAPKESVLSIDGHPVEMFGIMGKDRALARANPASIVRRKSE